MARLIQADEKEGEWLIRAQNGDDEAFTLLVERYQNPVYNLCYRMLGSPQEAEDAAQESFWRAYQALKRYDRNRPFATWLLAIAAHYCIDQQRKQRVPIFEIEDWMEETLPETTPSPEKQVSTAQDQAAIRAILVQLNPQDRAAIILRYWYDFSEEEISQTLKLSISAVKSRLFRARQKLAAMWTAQESIAAERMKDESPAF